MAGPSGKRIFFHHGGHESGEFIETWVGVPAMEAGRHYTRIVITSALGLGARNLLLLKAAKNRSLPD
jgi:hypothetical protein